jgi:hypothetical protein
VRQGTGSESFHGNENLESNGNLTLETIANLAAKNGKKGPSSIWRVIMAVA